MTANVQVFGRRDCETIGALLRPATEKRQGTKSREVGHRLGSKRYEDCMSALAPMEGMTPARGDVGVERGGHLGERAECINGRVGGPIDGMGSKGGNPHRRMLPQLLRSGMKVAQEGI
jgi:hypothetical protein